MKRALALGVLAGGLLLAGSAHAEEDKIGRLGIGADSSLAGFPGMSIQYGLTKSILGQAIVRGGKGSVQSGGMTLPDATYFSVALRASHSLASFGSTGVSALGGLNVGYVSPDGADSDTDLAVEGGLAVGHNFNKNFSIALEAGVAVFLTDDLDILAGLGSTVDTFGAAGFTYWF